MAEGRKSVLPDVGETRLMKVIFPPDAVMMSLTSDPSAEYMSRLPGLAKRFEPENPGMHTTDTVDYGILVEGEISLELDDGQVVALKPGDVVVQNGTRHAWRNPGPSRRR
ncbi:cupin domain-containing protein [Bradyrhizobium sp. CB82]|uniref:cupin domain-containing protein n=1 Tax=Bradyrhizobium sp. CB82 TaxID=3039159 RepID=UPI0024B1044E|nr:cupin domain-containing protein [Bradyrhizobium sp. CB82]WFU41513.1 cupin domain-containing protein [Bradyrhizobium sp. CB82]